MKVTCQTNNSTEMSERYFEIGYTHETEYDLVVGKIYVVFAQCLWKGCLLYLIDSSERGRPSWYPASIFVITDATLSSFWQFAYFKEYEAEGISAIWGYQELIQNEGHFDGLSERNIDDLKIFRMRKSEV